MVIMRVIKKNFKKITIITFCVIALSLEFIYFRDNHLKEVVKIDDTTDITQNADDAGNGQPNVLGSKLEIKQKFSDDFSEVVIENEHYLVVKVVDGDTIDIDMNGTIERLRLIGMNTPETVDPRRPVECFGADASKKAKELLVGKKVKIVNDGTQGNRDKYGRLLRYVFLEDGTFFNLWMIQNGYAHEYTYAVPYAYQADFKQAEVYARENNLGLWDIGVCDYNSVLKVQ